MSGQRQLQQPVQHQQPTQGAFGSSVGPHQQMAGSQPFGGQQSGQPWQGMAATGSAGSGFQSQQGATSQPGTTGGMYGAAGQVGGVGGPQVDREQLLQTVQSLHNFETVLEIARVRAIESGRPRVARVAGDLIAITEAERKLVIRGSPFAAPIGEAVKGTIQQGVQQLQGATEIPEVQEALQEAQQCINAIDRARSLLQGQEAAVSAGYQPMYGQGGQFGSMSQGDQTEYRSGVRQTAMRLHRFETVLQLAEMRAFERGRLIAARVAGDLAIIANLEKKLVVRQSPFAAPIGQAVRETVQQGVQQLQAAADDPDIQAALSEAYPTLSALQSAVQTTGGFQQGQGLQQWGQTFQPGAQQHAGGQPGGGGQPVTQPQQGQGLQQPAPGPY